MMDSHPHSSDSGLSIPTHSSTSTTLRCCCGRNDCALLEHNNVALEGLEKDLETAARLGQVCCFLNFQPKCIPACDAK